MQGVEHAKAGVVATKAAYAGSGGLAFLSFFTFDQWALIFAMIVSGLTFIANIYFKFREDRRGKRSLELEEKRLIGGMNKEAQKSLVEM